MTLVIKMTTQEYLNLIDEVNEKGKYKADWSSLSHHKVPEWYMHDKLGVFIHWGVYSVPAYGSEWYSRSMYDPNCGEFEYHRKTYGEHKDFGYKDFIPMFKAEKFDAKEWVSLFKKAGMKYVMPVAEHHDGFAMYDTEFNHWNAKEMELNDGKIDMIWNGMSITPARVEEMNMSKPYIANRQIIIVSEDSGIKTKADLAGKKVAAQAGSSAIDAMQADAETFASFGDLVEFDNNNAAYLDLKVGRVDAFVVDEVVGKYMISQDAE